MGEVPSNRNPLGQLMPHFPASHTKPEKGVVLHLKREESQDPSTPDRWETEVVATGEGEPFFTPAHWHAKHSEVITVREGRIEATLEGVTSILSAGESIHIPRYAIHEFRSFKGARAVVTEQADPPGDYKALCV